LIKRMTSIAALSERPYVAARFPVEKERILQLPENQRVASEKKFDSVRCSTGTGRIPLA
jgi:hypothetical protein